MRHLNRLLARARASTWSAPLFVAAAYYAGARLGFALKPAGQSVSMLWPPNAVLLGALLLVPRRLWPALIAAAVPVHFVAVLGAGIPFLMALCWFATNVTQALLGAVLIRRRVSGVFRLENLRNVAVFVLYGACVSPFLVSFLHAGFVALNHWGAAPYMDNWRIRFFSNVLAIVTIVPLMLAWDDRVALRKLSLSRLLEANALMLSLLALCGIGFDVTTPTMPAAPVLLYLPLPFLLWAATRFGPAGTSAALLIFAIGAINAAINGRGPFVAQDAAGEILGLQIFLILTYVPLLALAAVLRERATAERVARETNEKLRLALSAAQMGTWEVDMVNGRTTLSPESRQLFELAHGHFERGEMLRVIDERDHSHLLGEIQQALDSGSGFEAEFRVPLRDGTTRWIMTKGQFLRGGQNVTGMIGVHVDLTERKLAEAVRRSEMALRQSEARLRELADAMPQIVFSATPDGTIDYFNRKWYEFTGTEEDAVSERTWLGVIHPDDRLSCLAAWETSVHEGTPHEHRGRFLCAATGEYHWLLTRALPVRDANGRIRHWYGTATDINAFVRNEHALRESERQLRALGEALEHRVADRTAELIKSEERFEKAFRASPMAIAITRERDGRFVDVNGRWEVLMGFSAEEAIGRTIAELEVYPNVEDRERIASDLSTLGFVHELEVELSNKEGDRLHVVIGCELVEVGGEQCLVTMMRDITEKQRAEYEVIAARRQLAHLGRVAVLGELSSAIAHELNQPLTAILANARAAQRMLQRDPVDTKELIAILGDIASDDLRAGAVIHRVRALLRRGEADPQLMDLNEVATEVLDLAHSDLIQRGVSVITQLGDSTMSILGDRVQLQQVLLNLIVNGSEAMADNARPDRVLTVATIAEGDAVHLSVADRGTGIANAVVDSVFEPFVTSKPHGLGLGLSICRSIVNAHGGRMWATNNPTGGATFHMSIPIGAGLALQSQHISRRTASLAR